MQSSSVMMTNFLTYFINNLFIQTFEFYFSCIYYSQLFKPEKKLTT